MCWWSSRSSVPRRTSSASALRSNSTTTPGDLIGMFERYDENARRALFFARFEASQLGSRSIEPEHLLLGLLRLGQNAASPFLARLPDIRTPLEGSVRTKQKIPVSV